MEYIKKFDYIADCGGLEVCSPYLSITIPNGYGDGDWSAYLVTRDQHDALEGQSRSAWHYFTSFTVIEDEDCKGAYVGNLNPFSGCDDVIPAGRYGAFFNSGTIHLVKWN